MYAGVPSTVPTIVFVDEVHRFNKAQQDAFLPHVESGLFSFIGATTENPSFEVNSALLSRAAVHVLEPLEADVTVAGKVKARLFASTTAKDCDFIVKLIDVFPEGGGELSGYQMMVLGEVLPARFRQGPEVARPVTPGKVDAYEIDMRSCDHRFLKGHRIMVQVQSTWFPLIERNPQSLVDPFKATEADMRKATQRIARSPRFPTHIELPVIPD
ncbi:CocE/NonD family hydrolase [bacterium]|nr:CocE/NonD family hydrolase [bacterium]